MDSMNIHDVKKIVVSKWIKKEYGEVKKILITSRDEQQFEITLFKHELE